MLIDFFRLGIENLKNRKLRSWLTLIGIFIGITAVVALIGLGEGLKLAITSQFGISTTEVLTIQAGGLSNAGPPGTGVINPLTFDDVDAINNLALIEYAIPRLLETAKVEYNDNLDFSYVMSIADGEARDFSYEVMDFKLQEGRLLKDGDTKKVVLGYNYYADDRFEKPVRTGSKILIQGEEFEVVGITKKKGSFIFDNIIHMNEKTMKELYGNKDTVSIIVARVKDPSMLDQAKEDVEKLLRKRRDVKIGEEDFEVQTPDAALDQVNQVLTGVQIFIVIIASISILVGGIGIVNTMLTAVLERKEQIGTMKAIGAKNQDIFLLFFIESGILGFVGGLCGVIMGTLIAYFGTLGINNFVGASAAPQINFLLIGLALLGSFLVGSIAGIVPALRAAHENPVDALRGE